MDEILQDLQAFLQELLSKAPDGPLNCLVSKLLGSVGSATQSLANSGDISGDLETINDGLSNLVGGSGGFMQMLSKALQQALDNGDSDEAQRLLELIQTLLGQIQGNTSSKKTKGDVQKVLDSLGSTVDGLLGDENAGGVDSLLDSLDDTVSDLGNDLTGSGKLIFEREKLRSN